MPEWHGNPEAKLAVGVAGKLNMQPRTWELFTVALTDAGIDPSRLSWSHTGASEGLPATVQYLMLAGQDALSEWRPDLEIRKCHGRAMLAHDYAPNGLLLYPVFHPEAFFRRPEWRHLLTREAALLRTIAMDRDNWVSYTPETCVHCRGEFFMNDDYGVVYCEEHWASRSPNRPTGLLLPDVSR